MTKTYELTIGPLKRELPLIKINPTTTIASFVLLGDAELTAYAAEQLGKKLANVDFDYLVTMESKGIPLAQVLSDQTNHPHFIVLRKSVKDYMNKPLTESVHAITTSADQELVLDGADADMIRGKKVVIVDDVISSGGSLNTAQSLLKQADATVVKQLAILAEGPAAKRTDFEYLAPLPLF